MPQQSTRCARVVRYPLGTPDAIIVETNAGELIVVADPHVPAEKLEAIQLAAQHLPAATAELPAAFVPAVT